jgi:antirestriction protein
MTTTTTHEPRVWLGCLACYNNGRLLGEWMDPAAAAEEDGSTWQHMPDLSPHEELWVMDAEYVPVTGEFGIDMCRQIAEAYEELDNPDQWEAFCAYHQNVNPGGGPLDVAAFEDAFCGKFDSFSEYADDWIKEMLEVAQKQHGLDDDDPLIRFFDRASYAREYEQAFTVVEAPAFDDYGVYVFRDM